MTLVVDDLSIPFLNTWSNQITLEFRKITY